MKLRACEAASAASFQPLNAQTSAGALSPSGRCSHCNGCIRLTVHHCPMASGGVTVGSLRPGDEVRGVFACTRKDRLLTRAGSPYLALELRDRTGTVAARAFERAGELAAGFERGDLVSVVGQVERFRDELTVTVSAVEHAS